MKIVRRFKIKNELGLHMRPAALITQLLSDCRSSVFFTYNQQTINARSITEIMMMVAKKNAEIEVTMEGEDASKTMDLLAIAFESGFGEKDESR